MPKSCATRAAGSPLTTSQRGFCIWLGQTVCLRPPRSCWRLAASSSIRHPLALDLYSSAPVHPFLLKASDHWRRCCVHVASPESEHTQRRASRLRSLENARSLCVNRPNRLCVVIGRLSPTRNDSSALSKPCGGARARHSCGTYRLSRRTRAASRSVSPRSSVRCRVETRPRPIKFVKACFHVSQPPIRMPVGR